METAASVGDGFLRLLFLLSVAPLRLRLCSGGHMGALVVALLLLLHYRAERTDEAAAAVVAAL